LKEKIQQRFSGLHKVSKTNFFSNFISLSFFQFANYIIPLIIVPYLVRILGAENFGKINYAQVFASYFTILISFGFEYTSTKEIAENRNDHKKIQDTFNATLQLKAILFFVSCVVFSALFLFSEKLKEDFLLYIYSFVLNLGLLLFPNWYFQGIEKMRIMSVVNFLIKFSGVIALFLFIQNEDDYVFVPLISFVIQLFFSIWALFYVVSRQKLKLKLIPQFDLLKNHFIKGLPIFVSSVAISTYTILNFTILGLYENNSEIGYYSGAHKIIMAILMLTSVPLNTSLYPALSRKIKDSKEEGTIILRRAVKYVFFITFGISIMVFIASPFLVRFILGSKFEASVVYLQIFSFQPLFVSIASLLTIQGLYNFGLQKYSPFIGFGLGIFCVLFNIILLPIFGGHMSALSWVIAEIIEIVVVYIILRKKNIRLF
jgi:PST family polysaccharide transporter